MSNVKHVTPPPRYQYIEVLVELAWSKDSESYAGGGTAKGIASFARQVKGDNQDKKEYPGIPVWDWGVGLTTPLHKQYVLFRRF
jgi:hypothetical protein